MTADTIGIAGMTPARLGTIASIIIIATTAGIITIAAIAIITGTGKTNIV